MHSINPLTGYTKNSSILATSVIAKDCATADAYATAFMVMDLKDSKQLLNQQQDIEAYIIYLDEEGNNSSYITEGFKAQLVATAF